MYHHHIMKNVNSKLAISKALPNKLQDFEMQTALEGQHMSTRVLMANCPSSITQGMILIKANAKENEQV